MPPAQSCAPRVVSQPAGAHSQWAIGGYTRIDHSARKTAHPNGLSRLATAPVASTGVMIANIIW